MTTEYSDFKTEPTLADIVVDVASEQYGDEFRAKSRAGHEALVAWLIVRADSDVVDDVLAEYGFDSIDDLVDFLADGRFENDDQFDPLAAVETPRALPDGGVVAGQRKGRLDALEEQFLNDPDEPSNHD